MRIKGNSHKRLYRTWNENGKSKKKKTEKEIRAFIRRRKINRTYFESRYGLMFEVV